MSVDVIRSVGDKRLYRVIKLKNGLTALLVSDGDSELGDNSLNEDTENIDLDDDSIECKDFLDDDIESKVSLHDTESKDSLDDGIQRNGGGAENNDLHEEKISGGFSAAALCVRAGSWMEPDNLPGLAHFLEHMLFLGSQKYPDENDFDRFIKEHGGQTNANTHAEWTSYFFDVQDIAFKSALDRFANFFIHPLMCMRSVEKEVKMIHSEWAMKARIDKIRFEQLLGMTARKGHPIGKFTWGNQESLQSLPASCGIDVCQALKNFWIEHYLAQYMTLVVLSRECLDVLQSWVVEIFEGIAGSSKPMLTFEHLGVPFDTPEFRRIYKIIPCWNKTKMQLTWALDSLVQHYRKKPLHYLGMLVGHEGRGSLASFLRERNLAHAVESGVFEVPDEFNTACSCFQVSLTLTKEGMAAFEKVITVVFQYLKLLSIKGFHRSFWDEAFQIEKTKFRFLEQTDAMKYVDQLAKDMHRYQPQDYIIGNLMFEYDEELLQSCLEALKPHTMNIALWSKAFKDSERSWCEEKWFKTEYVVQDIPQDWIRTWANCDCLPELSLPEPNVYIATDFRLKSNDCLANYLETPLTDTDLSRLFFSKDEEFRVPKASINFFLKSCEADKSPSSACMLDLYVELLKDHIAQVIYPAELAEISCCIVALDRGLVIRINGFSHKLTRLFVAIVDRIATFQVREDLFSTLKQDLKGFYKNYGLNPEVLNKQLRRSLLFDCHWDVMRKYESISAVSLDSFSEFIKSFYAQMYVEGLIQGNIMSKKAKSVESFLLCRLGIKAPQNPEYLRQNQVKRIPPGCSVFITFNKSADDENSVITNYYQYGRCSLREFLINEIILTKMEEPCFARLRTSKLLGYHIQSGSTYLYGVVGFTITICSLASKCSMQVLDDSIEEFLHDFHNNHIEKMTEEALSEIIATEIRLKQNCGPANLQSEVDRRWKEILENSYVFDRLIREINELKTITLQDLKSWSRNFIAPESKRRKLSIQVVGNARQCAPRRQPGSKRPPLNFLSPNQQPTTYPNPRPTTFPNPRASTNPNPRPTTYPNPRVFTSIEEFKSECERF